MAKDYRRLWKNVISTADEDKAVRTLAKILVDKEGRAFMKKLERKDAELCIEILDHIIGIAEFNLRTIEKQAFFVTLRRLAGIHGRLPDSVMITEKIEVEDEVLASGGFSDVRIGKYKGHLVAVKTMRLAEQDDILKIRKQFCKEVVLWNTLSHPNVLKLVGVQGDMEKGQFITVSEWMAHGNIMRYIRNNSVNRLELLHGAAQGLKYLHSANLTHGDLEGANILMSNDAPPRACLADFGFMTVVFDPSQPMSCSAQMEDGTMTFMSPELMVPSNFGFKDSIPTPEADIYAFGLVIFQVLTGENPFRGVRMGELLFNVVRGVRPTKPENASAIGFSDSLWHFTQQCWHGKAKMRPKVGEVVTQLERAAADWGRVMPPFVEVENVVPVSERSVSSDSMSNYKFIVSSSDVAPESPIELQTTSVQSDEEQLGDPNNITETGKEYPRSLLELSPFPALPQAPTNCFSREEITNEVLDLTDQVSSTALFGSIGVGKSFVALTLLHHDRTKAKFGGKRHFMRCDSLTNPLEDFLEHLSDAIGANRTTNIGQLRSHLESSPPLILLLDGVDLIIDPQTPKAEEISAIIVEFGCYEHVCLVTTSRTYPEIPGFHRVEVPTLSEDGARETFYGLCNLGRSPVVDDLIVGLDFHPLSIDLLASSVRENGWDETALLKAWDDSQTSVLKQNYHQRLKDTMELSFRSPTIQKLGTTARDVLGAVAAFPDGIREHVLGNTFAGTTEVGVTVDVLCRFSLIYRQDGLVKMLSPFRFYFLESMLEPAQSMQVLHCNATNCSAAKAWLPIYTAGPPKRKPPKTTKPSSSPLNISRSRNPRPMTRQFLTLLCLAGVSIDLDDTQAAPTNKRSTAPVQQEPPAAAEAYNVE